MKKNIACILMLFSIVLTNYSLKAYAENTKPINGSEFITSYEGKNIKELIELLGDPKEVQEKNVKYSKPGFEESVYIWEWYEVEKLPVKIIHDIKKGTIPYYVDYIKAMTEGEKITSIKLKKKKKFIIP